MRSAPSFSAGGEVAAERHLPVIAHQHLHALQFGAQVQHDAGLRLRPAFVTPLQSMLPLAVMRPRSGGGCVRLPLKPRT